MAETKKFVAEFEVNADGAIIGIKKITAATDDAVKGTNNLKGQIRELSKELANTDPQSEKYVELSKKIGQLKDQVNDAAEAIKANAGGAFENLAGNAGLLGQRISSLDFEGASSSLKGLTQNVKQLDFKGLSAGLGDFVKGIGGLGKALLTNPIFLLAAAIGAAVAYSDELLSLVDGISSADEKQLKAQQEKASLAKEQVDAIGQQEEILKQQGKSEKEITALKLQALETAISEQEITLQTQKNQLVAQVEAAKRNKDFLVGILNFLTAPTRFLLNVVDSILDGANAVGVISDETRQNIGDLSSTIDKANEAIASTLFDPEQVKKDGEAAIKESEKQLISLKNTKAGIENKINEESVKGANDRAKKIAEAETRVNDELKKLSDERRMQKLSDEERELEQSKSKFEALIKEAGTNAELISQIETEQELARNEIKQKYLNQRLAIEKKANEISRQLAIQQEQEVIAIEEEISEALRQSKMSAKDKEIDALQTNYFERVQILEQNNQSTLEATELFEQQKRDIEQKYADEKKKSDEQKAKEEEDRARELREKRVQAASDFFSILQSINEAATTRTANRIKEIDGQIANARTDEEKKQLLARRKALENEGRKAFERNKALQIAQALIQTYTSATGAYNAQQSIPTPDAPIRGALAAGAAIAAGLLNVNKIRQTKYDSGGSGDVGGSSSAPAIQGNLASPINPNTANAPDASRFASRPNQPTAAQAYVLAGDVTNAQSARTKIEDLARLSGSN